MLVSKSEKVSFKYSYISSDARTSFFRTSQYPGSVPNLMVRSWGEAVYIHVTSNNAKELGTEFYSLT